MLQGFGFADEIEGPQEHRLAVGRGGWDSGSAQ